MALWVKQQTLGLGLGHDLRVVRLSPAVGSVLRVESACDSPSPSASPPRMCLRSLSFLNK